ncbi:hypothetical protein NECAME_18067, partial [Necator americanus]
LPAHANAVLILALELTLFAYRFTPPNPEKRPSFCFAPSEGEWLRRKKVLKPQLLESITIK